MSCGIHLQIATIGNLGSYHSCCVRNLHIDTWSSWSYSHENGPLRSSTSVSSSHQAKMWGVNHAIFGIIRNAMSYSITRWNMTIFWRANFMLYHFKSKICFFYKHIFSPNTVCQGQSLPLNFAPAEKYSSIFYLFCVHNKGKRGLLQ